MQTIHARVEGRVQGVFFREFTRQEAQQLRLNGWVKNMPDGSVEAEFQGNKENIDRMKEWLENGSPQAIVTRVFCQEVEKPIEYSDFQVRW